MAKLGAHDLKGAAVDLLAALIDDNGDSPADEARAIKNFDSFADSYFRQSRQFIKDAGKASVSRK